MPGKCISLAVRPVVPGYTRDGGSVGALYNICAVRRRAFSRVHSNHLVAVQPDFHFRPLFQEHPTYLVSVVHHQSMPEDRYLVAYPAAEKFAVPDDTVLHIDFAVEPAELEAAGTSRLELQLFRDVPEFTVSFFTALVLWILGILTVLIGAIWWLRHLTGDVEAPVAASPGDEERLWAMFCHLSAMLGYLLPFGQLIGPSVVWMAKRDRSGFIDAHGREALNFQISVMLYAVIALIACFVLIGFLLLFALVIFHVSMTLYASLRAQQGDAVRYPMALRILPARHFTSG